jgi:hypothetical protein
MASREHQSGRTKIKVETIHLNFLGGYVEWGGKAWRKRRHDVEPVLWKPWTWNRSEWRYEGTPPLTDVEFLDVDGKRIPNEVLNPSTTSSTGKVKIHVVYVATSQTTELGNDARSVDKVVVHYRWDDEDRTISEG